MEQQLEFGLVAELFQSSNGPLWGFSREHWLCGGPGWDCLLVCCGHVICSVVLADESDTASPLLEDVCCVILDHNYLSTFFMDLMENTLVYIGGFVLFNSICRYCHGDELSWALDLTHVSPAAHQCTISMVNHMVQTDRFREWLL